MMPSILTPISHLFFDSHDSFLISSTSDYLEARERTCEIILPNTTHYHIDFDLNLGLSQDQIDFLHRHVKPREEIHTLTFQASRDCEDVELQDGLYHPKSRSLSISEQVVNIKNTVSKIRDIVGSDRQIGFENNNYYPSGAYDICTSLEFFEAVFSQTNLHLLLDHAHAKVTAFNKGIDSVDYIDALLSFDCRQIHVCQFMPTKSSKPYPFYDAHELPTDQLLAEIVPLINKHSIPYLTVEYYKSAPILIDFLSALPSYFA